MIWWYSLFVFCGAMEILSWAVATDEYVGHWSWFGLIGIPLFVVLMILTIAKAAL